MENMKERLEQGKIRLEIFKHNLMCMKEYFHVKESFFVEKGKENNDCIYYDISQNLSSFPFTLSVFQYPNAITCFFVELFNFYQDLPKRSNYPYRSFSQELTTYFLRELAEKQLIELVFCKKSVKVGLDAYMEMLGNYNHKEKIQMYYCYFYKKRNMDEKDVPMIKNIASALHINLSYLKFVFQNDKMYLEVKNTYKFKNFIRGRYFKNLYQQREYILLLLKEYGEYLFDQDSVTNKKKRTLKVR